MVNSRFLPAVKGLCGAAMTRIYCCRLSVVASWETFSFPCGFPLWFSHCEPMQISAILSWSCRTYACVDCAAPQGCHSLAHQKSSCEHKKPNSPGFLKTQVLSLGYLPGPSSRHVFNTLIIPDLGDTQGPLPFNSSTDITQEIEG